MAQHNANADVVANMENSLRVCILPKSHTPDGAAGYDAFVFDDSNVQQEMAARPERRCLARPQRTVGQPPCRESMPQERF